MNWMPTHRIIYAAKPNESEAIEVMAWDLGHDHRGPARYALYTEDQRQAESEPDWAMDVEGGVWLHGEVLPESASALVESLLD
jgi:hypothetical protein